MHLAALKHMAAMAVSIAGNSRIVVFGSASLLGSYPSADLDYELIRRSGDADFVLDPWEDEVALLAHESLGVDSEFDKENGYHADIIRPMAFENFPPGWDDRLVGDREKRSKDVALSLRRSCYQPPGLLKSARTIPSKAK